MQLDELEDLRERAQDNNAEDGITGAPCGSEDGASGTDAYPAQCTQLRDALGVHSANVAVAAVGWVVAGLSAGGTVTYMMLDWYDGSRKAKPMAPNYGFAPVIAPGVTGGTLYGRF